MDALRSLTGIGLAVGIIIAPAFAAAQNTLPADVVAFNQRRAPCMKATGAIPKELIASLMALQKTKQCMALQPEWRRLLARYKGNKLATMALQNHVGFIVVRRYPAPH